MGDGIKQEHVAGSNPEQGKEFAGRRNVIKGLAATVPVILTITSGEAAATTSMLQCVGGPGAEHAPKWIGKDKRDKWVRVKKHHSTRGHRKIYKNRLVYADKWGKVVHQGYGGKPFTHSCYNSFLPKK